MGTNGKSSKRKSASPTTSRKQWNVGMFPHERLQVRALMVALDRPSEADTLRFILTARYRDELAAGRVPDELDAAVADAKRALQQRSNGRR